MALKPDRYEDAVDISYFFVSGNGTNGLTTATAERGVLLIHRTSGSGAAMDQAEAAVCLPTGAAGNVAGLLLNDVVNVDLTRQHLNQHQDEVQTGGKVALLRRGYVVTDKIVSGNTPTAGEAAYLEANGEISNAQNDTQGGAPIVGRFLSSLDEDGYAKVEILIQ